MRKTQANWAPSTPFSKQGTPFVGGFGWSYTLRLVFTSQFASTRRSPPFAASRVRLGRTGADRARRVRDTERTKRANRRPRVAPGFRSTASPPRLDSTPNHPHRCVKRQESTTDGQRSGGEDPVPARFFGRCSIFRMDEPFRRFWRTRKNRNLCGLLGYLLGFFVGLYSIEGLESSEASTSNLCWCKCFHFNPSNHHN